MPQLGDNRRVAGENDVRVKAGGVLIVGDAHEIFLVHFLDRLDGATSGGDFRGNLVEGVLDAVFLARHVQDEQTFVSFHFFFSSFLESTTPLNRFIAFSIPSASQHSAWSAARTKTFSISAASSALKRAST